MGSSMENMTKWVQKLCLEVQNCHFSMDEPIGSFYPVQGA